MAKSPAFQFYPGDWLRNDVSGCSLEAQGLWLRMMMIMHDAQVYGQLILNNEPMSPEFIAKKIGISPKKYSNLLAELDFAGVINRHENGVIYSGRMERDERKRQLDRERQAEKYRRDHPESGPDNEEIESETSRNPHAEPHGTSSSSSSTSIKEEEIKEDTPPAVTAGKVSDIPALMQFHQDRIGRITDGGAQAKAIDRILHFSTAEDAIDCYKFQVQELKPHGWRSTVSWTTVLKYLPEWVLAGRPKRPQDLNGTNRQNSNGNKQTPGQIIANRPYRTGNTD